MFIRWTPTQADYIDDLIPTFGWAANTAIEGYVQPSVNIEMRFNTTDL
jgi:hypothetical protein